MGTDVQKAELWMKSPGIFAGVPFFNAVFDACGGCVIHWEDGTSFCRCCCCCYCDDFVCLR